MSYVLVLALAILQVGDWLTTHLVIERGGHEANPLMSYLIATLGFDLALALKGAMVVMNGCVMEYVMPFSSLTLVIFYAVICYHNWKQIG